MGLQSRTIPFASIDPSLRDGWSALVGTELVDLSMAPQWFECTVRSRGAGGRAFVFVVYDDRKLVGLVPYVVQPEDSAALAARSRECPGSYLVAYHPGVVGSIETERLLELYIEDASHRCDVIVLPNLPQGGRTAAAALEIVRRRRLRYIERAGHASPFLPIQGTWDDFLATKNTKFRNKIRRELKNLERAGEFHNRWFAGESEVDEFLATMLSIEENSWKADAGMAVSASGLEREYHRLLLPFLAAQHSLRANAMYLDSVPIAYSLCYVSDGCVRQLKTSFDQRYARLAPGAVCQHLAIRDAFERGAREFDFLGDNMPHKRLWANSVRDHVTLYLFLPTWRGAALYGARRFVDLIRRGGAREGGDRESAGGASGTAAANTAAEDA